MVESLSSTRTTVVDGRARNYARSIGPGAWPDGLVRRQSTSHFVRAGCVSGCGSSRKNLGL